MAAGTKSVYKQLLVAVDKHLTRVAGNTLWRGHVKAAFRRNAQELQDAALVQRELQLARDYQQLVSNIAKHQVRA